jgi:DNA-binding MarR family transcriptional regulator
MTAHSIGLSRDGIERLADIIMVLQRCCVLNLSAELSKGEVSFPQFFLLGHIVDSDSLSMTEIAERMKHTTAAATGLVDRLENLGYVQRRHDAGDRRKVLVQTTRKGQALVSRIRADIVEKLTGMIAVLSPEEQETWLRIYEKLHTYISCSDPS